MKVTGKIVKTLKEMVNLYIALNKIPDIRPEVGSNTQEEEETGRHNQ